jgi:putative transposase
MKVYDPQSGRWVYQKRLQHYDEPGHARSLTFSCYHGYRFLEKDRTRKWFLESLCDARATWHFSLWAYVIMPEHVHLLIYPPPDNPKLTAVLRDIKEPVGRNAISYLRQHAPGWLERITVREGTRVRHRFWQPGAGYDRNVTQARIEYIHANPVRRGLVERAEDWEWSSARWYSGIRPVAIEMDPLLPDVSLVVYPWTRGG